MNIVKLNPWFTDYLWGGTKLRDVYQKDCNMDKIAESWELSTHKDGQSVVTTGEFKGLVLSEYIEKNGREILGKNGEKFENFPVLIKFIDAKQPLSVQVHPSDEYALEHEGQYGKTEMWYIMECDEGSSLYFGVNKDISKEEFKSKIEDNTVEEVLNKVPVKKGDCFFIEAGTIHAIGAGIVICEIQQNSNITYRVYDYDRRDDAGNPRELHVDKAIKVSKLSPSDTEDKQGELQNISGGTAKELASCKYFTTEKYDVETEVELNADENSFVSLTMLSGEGEVVGSDNAVSFKTAESIFIPANAGKITVKGKCSFIKTTV